MNAQQILSALNNIKEPNSGKGIVEKNMVVNLEKKANIFSFDLKIEKEYKHTSTIKKQCVELLKNLYGNDFNVIINTILSKEQKTKNNNTKQKPKGVKNIVLISSGKGGVGKSTATVNIALKLKDLGLKVAIVDADIYGPSIPKIFSLENYRPIGININGVEKIQPANELGIDIMSIGFFCDPKQPIPWRGPMVSKALKQMIMDTNWENIDILLIDMPPGTGDIHLSIAGGYDIKGSYIITTPQDIALSDVRKSIGMYNMKNVEVKILGIIENMSYFQPEKNGKKYYIFGKGGAEKLSKEYGVKIISKIPIMEEIRKSCDEGTLININTEDIYTNIANDLINNLNE